MYIIAFLIFGLVIGLIARALMPGNQSMGWVGTILLGVGGSLIGGTLGNLIFGGRWDQPVAAGWIGSVLGALLLLLILGMATGARSRRA